MFCCVGEQARRFVNYKHEVDKWNEAPWRMSQVLVPSPSFEIAIRFDTILKKSYVMSA